MAGLTDKLVSADAVASAVRAYAEELNRPNHERRAQADIDHRMLAKIERGIAGVLTAMKARMGDLERQKAEIIARLNDAPEDVLDVHPNIAELYRAKVIRLHEALADPELYAQAAENIRSLVGEVVLTPGAKRGDMQAVLRGELMGILDMVAERKGGSYNKARFWPPKPIEGTSTRNQQRPGLGFGEWKHIASPRVCHK